MAPASFLNTSHQTIGWFADLKDRLILRPPFQRRPVWLDEEKSFLIDSILRGYPVPEIYVQSDASGERVAVVDGQQRLRACLEYLEDGFAVHFDVEKLRPLYTLEDTPWFGLKFSQLPPELQPAFRRYKLIVRDLEDVDDAQLRHMFHRLNQSKFSLNEQELRYSMYSGGLLACAEDLVGLGAWDHYGIFTKLQRRRMLDTEFVSELILGFLHWPQNKKDNLDNYYRQYAAAFPFDGAVRAKFGDVLDYLVNLFPNSRMNRTRWYRKSDFYTLFLAFARGKLQMGQTEIEAQREALTDFSRRVDGPEEAGEPPAVALYRQAVQRAATDRARRVRREDALVAFMTGSQIQMGEPELGTSDGSDEAEDDAEYEDPPLELV